MLVTFEGPEGSGKSTLISSLAAHLRARGVEPLLTREPGGTAIGERIRGVLLDPASAGMAAETELLLMVASRAQLAREVIRPALADGRLVLCDRFADASVAYQGFGRGLGRDLVDRLNTVALDGLRPDLTLLCLLPPELGLARIGGRAPDRLDAERLEFHQRVYDGYRALAAEAARRFRVLDATAGPDQLLAAALEQLRGLEHGLLCGL
ncbi:MAG: dTMP kinase [bacterium]|nr:dTMP kinase [bacterium]